MALQLIRQCTDLKPLIRNHDSIFISKHKGLAWADRNFNWRVLLLRLEFFLGVELLLDSLLGLEEAGVVNCVDWDFLQHTAILGFWRRYSGVLHIVSWVSELIVSYSNGFF